MRRIALLVAVFSVVFSIGLTQNRGRSRYVPPPDDYDGDDNARQSPPPPRVTPSSRRFRTTPSAYVDDDEPQRLREPQTSGRRTSSRTVPTEPAVRDPISIYGPSLENTPIELAPEQPEVKPPSRRRRPKKRRRPQAADVIPEKQGIPIADDGRTSIRTLIDDDEKRPRNIIRNEEPPTRHEGPNDSQFFRQQPPSNRLPVRHQEPHYHSDVESNRPYDSRSEYKPVLPHAAIDESSRLPPTRYVNENEEVRPISGGIHSIQNTRLPPTRGHPVLVEPQSDRHEIGKGPEDNLLKNTHGHGASENRLPHNDPASFSHDYQDNKYPYPGVDYAGRDEDSHHLHSDPHSHHQHSHEAPVENANSYTNPSNRLPTPGEEREQSGIGQRSRNTLDSYNSGSQDSARKPQEVSDERSVRTRYQTPLPSTPSRYQPETPDRTHRSRSTTRNQETTTPSSRSRSRSSSRYTPRGHEELPTRPESQVDSLPKDNTEKLSRGPPRRYQPDVVSEAPVRTRGLSRNRDTSRLQPERVRESTRQVEPETNYRAPVAAPPPIPQYVSRTRNDEESRDDVASLRHTLRSRPQYDSVQPYSHTEPEDNDDANRYVPEVREPRTRQPSPSPVNEYVPRQRPPQYPPPSEGSRTDRQPVTSVPRRQQTSQHSPPARQQPQPNRRPQPSSRHQEPEGQQSRASRFSCPDPYGFFGDPEQCDKYYECRNGTSYESLCQDGLGFNEGSAPKFLRCDSLRDVDCSSRPRLQEASPTKNCPRRFGLYPHEEDCTKFWNCVDGIGTVVQCPPGLTYNDGKATCDWADLVTSSCKTEDLLGFTCPEPTAFDLQDGVYTRYAHPTNCQLHFTCIKGADGLRRPRMLSCGDYQVFDEASGTCQRPEDVPGCEDFFGERRPKPRRQPAREPEEEPEPEIRKPRNRNQNRRARN